MYTLRRDRENIYSCKIMDNKISEIFVELIEPGLRAIVRDEVIKAIDSARQQAKPERMLTRREVSQLLHISLPTLWSRVKEGKINASKNGRRVLFAETEIKRYLEGAR